MISLTFLSHNSLQPAPGEPSKIRLSAQPGQEPIRHNDAICLVIDAFALQN